MFKNQKGITLIALVITIIVLLILAGITIALITNNDSAPNKASEAKIEQEVGAAKDTVTFNATELMTEYYEALYVKSNKTTSDTGYATVGTYVGLASNNSKLIQNVNATEVDASGTSGANIKLVSVKTNAKGQVYTITGSVNATDGTITWNMNTAGWAAPSGS